MTSLRAHPQPAQVRDLTRRGVPLHFAPALVVVIIGVGLLLAGGVAAGFGGWLLAAALPIAIGAFLRSPRFAALPPAVWAGWLIVVGLAPADATLAHTPVFLAVMLAAVGAGATLLAQRAIFPATDPTAWEVSANRSAPMLDEDDAEDDADPLEGLSDELGELDEAVVAGIEAAQDEADAEEPEQEHVAELPLGADPAPLDEGGHVTDFPALSLDEIDDSKTLSGAVAEARVPASSLARATARS